MTSGIVSLIILAATIVGVHGNVGDITVRHVTTMTISNPRDDSNLKEMELLRRHVLNQHFSALALGPHPDLIEPRLAQIIERESYLDSPIDAAREACALDARRLCTNPEDKAALHCLGMADLKLKQPVSDQCRTKIKLSIPYACSIEIDEYRCNGVDQSLLDCIDQNAKKVSGDCADSLYLTKKFLSLWDSTRKTIDDRNAAQTIDDRTSKKTGNGTSVDVAAHLDGPVAQKGFIVARSSNKLISEKVAIDMVKDPEELQFKGGLILIMLAGGISAWACLFASPRRLADAPAIVSVKEVELREEAPLLKFDDSSKSDVLL